MTCENCKKLETACEEKDAELDALRKVLDAALKLRDAVDEVDNQIVVLSAATNVDNLRKAHSQLVDARTAYREAKKPFS